MRWVVSATHRPLYPRKETRCLFYRRLGGSQSCSGRLRKISTPPGFDPSTVQPVASCYTDCDIPARLIHCYAAPTVDLIGVVSAAVSLKALLNHIL
jgi:hypothetical protein